MTMCVSNYVSISTTRYIIGDIRHEEEQSRVSSLDRRTQHGSIWVRMAMRVSRAKWFNLLRRIFHYQNGSSSPLGENPFNSSSWMVLELLSIVLQISVSLIIVAISKEERPAWPMRVWVIGYDLGCVMNIFIICWRFGHYHFNKGNDRSRAVNMEQPCTIEDSRKLQSVSKCKASLDLYFAMWFVIGNVWVFGTRFGSNNNEAPKLHVLCIFMLIWNAITYSFPFLLFLLLCIFVPLISSLIGYNMSLGSAEKGASYDQISKLLCWTYKHVESHDLEAHDVNSSFADNNPVCCICLAKYKEKEEIRQLPCSHIFHKICVDQWLGMISCCPLCKQGLDN